MGGGLRAARGRRPACPQSLARRCRSAESTPALSSASHSRLTSLRVRPASSETRLVPGDIHVDLLRVLDQRPEVDVSGRSTLRTAAASAGRSCIAPRTPRESKLEAAPVPGGLEQARPLAHLERAAHEVGDRHVLVHGSDVRDIDLERVPFLFMRRNSAAAGSSPVLIRSIELHGVPLLLGSDRIEPRRQFPLPLRSRVTTASSQLVRSASSQMRYVKR